MKVLPFSVPECKRFAQKLVGGHERCAEYFAERVQRDGLKPACIADVGCGTMTTTRKIARLLPEAHVVGCDIQEHAARSEADPANLEYRQIKPFSLASENLQPDIISLGGVVHHICPADEDRFMQDLLGALKPGGRLLVHEHQLSDHSFRRRIEELLLRMNEFLTNEALEGMACAYNFFTRSRLRALLERNGFSVLDEEDTGRRFVTIPTLNRNMAFWCAKGMPQTP